jgi:hypothetical protein
MQHHADEIEKLRASAKPLQTKQKEQKEEMLNKMIAASVQEYPSSTGNSMFRLKRKKPTTCRYTIVSLKKMATEFDNEQATVSEFLTFVEQKNKRKRTKQNKWKLEIKSNA